MLTGVSLTVFTFTGLTLFFVIVFKHLDVGFLTNARRLAATSHGTDGNLSHYGELEDDSFALHPEQHVFRAPQTIRLDWNITREARRPDGVLKDVYLINGPYIFIVSWLSLLLSPGRADRGQASFRAQP